MCQLDTARNSTAHACAPQNAPLSCLHFAELNGCVTERYDQSYVCQVKAFDDKVRWLNMTYHMQQVPVYRVPRYVLNRWGLARRQGKGFGYVGKSQGEWGFGFLWWTYEGLLWGVVVHVRGR